MKTDSNKIFLLYILLYISMLLGYYFNEDFAYGTIYDYTIHKKNAQILNNDIVGTFLNYDDLRMPHSPIYLLYFFFINNFFGESIGKLINIHLTLLIPLFTYLSLNLKFNFKKNNLVKFLPLIFFISPYYRSGAIWIDDNILSICFLTISIYFYLESKISQNNLKFILLNTLFLSLAAYFRPIYSIFGLYFFFSYFFQFKISKKFIYYIFFNIILSFPAFYYIFILDINEWFAPYILRVNLITILSLTISLIFFYSIPFVLSNINKSRISFYDKNTLLFSLIFLILLFFSFDYGSPKYSGGIFYKFSILIFNNNYFFYICSFISFYFILLIFTKFVKKNDLFLDLILLLILIFMGIHGRIYHEMYDPLFYILAFLLIKNNFYTFVIKNLTKEKITYFFLFAITFYFFSIIKTFIYERNWWA